MSATTVVVNDVKIAVDSVGDGDVIALVHGWSGSRAAWDPIVDDLARSHTVVTFDHRGHGGSQHVSGDGAYAIDRLVEDFEALIRALDIGPFHLVGHSLGGLVAMRYAIDRPEQVRSLVLVDTGARPAADSAALMEPLIELVQTEGLDGYYERALPFVSAGPAGERLATLMRRGLETLDPAAFVTLARELTQYPSVLEQLQKLRMITTVIVGENDIGLRPASDELVAAIDGAVLEVIPEAAHSPQVENPAEWLAAVKRHLHRAGS
jgi:pimeloyl-ACP methyl ester carboxylesterase